MFSSAKNLKPLKIKIMRKKTRKRGSEIMLPYEIGISQSLINEMSKFTQYVTQ